MANEVEQLNTIKARLADVHADVRARLDEVRGELSPQGQAAMDEVVAALESFDAEIGDADGSDTPTGGDTGGDAGAGTGEPGAGDDGTGTSGGTSAGVPA